jgi:hypothetical protein
MLSQRRRRFACASTTVDALLFAGVGGERNIAGRAIRNARAAASHGVGVACDGDRGSRRHTFSAR